MLEKAVMGRARRSGKERDRTRGDQIESRTKEEEEEEGR
jgi:hypothetical protein